LKNLTFRGDKLMNISEKNLEENSAPMSLSARKKKTSMPGRNMIRQPAPNLITA